MRFFTLLNEVGDKFGSSPAIHITFPLKHGYLNVDVINFLLSPRKVQGMSAYVRMQTFFRIYNTTSLPGIIYVTRGNLLVSKQWIERIPGLGICIQFGVIIIRANLLFN